MNDKNGNPIYQNFTITEAVTVVDPGNITANLQTAGNASNPTGQFLDDLKLIGPSSTAIPANACEIIKQAFTASGNANPIRVNCIQYGPTSVTITDVSSNPALCVKGTTYHCN